MTSTENQLFEFMTPEVAACFPDVAERMDGQRLLLRACRDTTRSETRQLEKLRAQIAEQVDLIANERNSQKILLEKGLAQASRRLAPKREKRA